MRIPFTKYEIKVSKRSVNVLNNGELVSFVDWANGKIFSANTPIMEEIYQTIASEFGKIDLRHVISKNGMYKDVNSDLNYVVSERPNALQTKFDFLYTMMYQLLKYGNAIAYLERNEKGNVIAISPVDVYDYELGKGYQTSEDSMWLKVRNKKTGMIELVDYNNVIHLRLNPNDVFNGDICTTLDNGRLVTRIIDASLNSLLAELGESGTVRGIIKLGNNAGGFAKALSGDDNKIAKQNEITNRIKNAKGGVLVLDSGEEWQSLNSPFKTVSSADISEYTKLLYTFSGISEKIVNGTATDSEMEVFFNKKIVPRIEQLVSEMNYKIFSKTARTQGNRIEYYRNPFEYLPIDKAIDVAYKGAMDTTTNERRRMIYKLPPVEGGDVLRTNLNFAEVMEDDKKNSKTNSNAN